jgi:hypothetical protein
LGDTSESLLDGLGVRVQMEFVLNQLARDSGHVRMLPCKDVPIFLEEFDEHEFLYGIQFVAYVSNLGRFLHRQWYLLAECILWFDGCFGRLGAGNDRVRGGGEEDSAKDSFSSQNSADAVNLSAISQPSLSQS